MRPHGRLRRRGAVVVIASDPRARSSAKRYGGALGGSGARPAARQRPAGDAPQTLRDQDQSRYRYADGHIDPPARRAPDPRARTARRDSRRRADRRRHAQGAGDPRRPRGRASPVRPRRARRPALARRRRRVRSRRAPADPVRAASRPRRSMAAGRPIDRRPRRRGRRRPGRGRGGRGSTDRRVLAAAAELARGTFLAGFSLRDSAEFDDWRATRAVAAERSVGRPGPARRRRGRGGDLATAVDAATRRLALDPLDEAAHRRLMTIQARSGDRAAAIRQYRACVAVLDRELGVAPLAETTELYEAIRDARVEVAPGGGGTTAAQPIPEAIHGPATLPMVGRAAALEATRGTARARRRGRPRPGQRRGRYREVRLVDAVAETVPARRRRAGPASRAFAGEVAIAYGPIVELLRVGLTAVEPWPGWPGCRLGCSTRWPDWSSSSRSCRAPVGRPRVGDRPRARIRRDGRASSTRSQSSSRRSSRARSPAWWSSRTSSGRTTTSREALRYLVRRLGGRPLLLVFTWRGEDLDAGAAFADARCVPDARHLALDRLAPPDVAGWCMRPWRAACWR